MTELLLRRELEPLARQHRRYNTIWRLTLLWSVAALAAAVLLLLRRAGIIEDLRYFLAGLCLLAALFVLRICRSGSAPDYKRIAAEVAQQRPELHTLLQTAVEQERDPASGRLGYMQERVISDALLEIRKRERIDTVPARAMVIANVVQLAAAAAFLCILFIAPRDGRPGELASRKDAPGRANQLIVTPGDASVEKGNALVVLARFEGVVPTEAKLVVFTNGGEYRLPLVKNLNDPIFGGSVPEVTMPFTYQVEHGGQRSPLYKVTVFEHPRLERSDVTIDYPSYTELPQKRIQDTRRVSAVEGSSVDLALQLNKPVRSARLLGRDKSTVELIAATNQAQAHLTDFRFARSQTYELQLVDADGRTNKLAPQFVFEVLTNQRPHLRIAFPRGDQRVSPLQEMFFQAEAHDDYGLRDFGLTYSLGGTEVNSLKLVHSAPANFKTNFLHLLKLEELKAQPDQLVSYFIWADDVGPDGQLRRTSSDMFFAEVRAFEEIYREGEGMESDSQQQQQQQQGGEQSPATQLAELQKQIINATWKIQRQESGTNVSPGAARDLVVVIDAQDQAIEQADTMEQRLQDYRMKESLQTAVKHMEKAAESLARSTNSLAALPEALAAEQAAYQALLKLQSREYQVVQQRNRSQGQQQRNSQRNQAQLDQLEMTRPENRYETQREASAPQSPEQREQLEALSRLKELAQRQEDINERLKDLQAALQQAKTEQERDELRRELKRLRDEQREMLSDMDELQQRMEQNQDQSRMAESRQRLEQARQDAQRASEALEQESVAQALAAGTRAERQLEEMRDDMRRQSSSQFSEEMRQMREDAREMANDQQQIRQQMEQLRDRPKSLSDSGETQQLAQQLNEQKRALTNLLGEIKRVTEQAENAEPLLSKQLYDTLRRTSQGGIDQSLSAAEELLKRNFLREAAPYEQRASTEIDSLKKDVERAAETVLGNEVDALRLAKRELDDLTAQLQRELARQSAGTNASGQGLASAANSAGTNGPAGAQARTNQMRFASATNDASRLNGLTNAIATGGRSGTNNSGRLASGARELNGRTNAASETPLASGNQVQRANENAADGTQSRAGQQEGNAPGQGQQQARSDQGQNQREGENGDAQQQAANANADGQQGRSPGEGEAQNDGRGQRNNAGNALTEIFNRNQDGGGSDGGGDWRGGPLTGEREFVEWNQRLSNVEEMVDQPELRNQLAQVRDRARAARSEFRRNNKSPQWELVNLQMVGPLLEVRDRIADELSRRESSESLAPIDRDPVPARFGELVRRYYENLGSSQ